MGVTGHFTSPGPCAREVNPAGRAGQGKGVGEGTQAALSAWPDCASLSLPALGESLHSPLHEGVDCCFHSLQLKQSWLPGAAGCARVGVFPATTPPARVSGRRQRGALEMHRHSQEVSAKTTCESNPTQDLEAPLASWSRGTPDGLRKHGTEIPVL